MTTSKRRPTVQEVDQRRAELRRFWQSFTDEALADRLFRLADEPRACGLDADERFALLYTAAARLRRPRAGKPLGPEPEHGTRNRYQWSADPCRCGDCRDAQAAYIRERRAARKAVTA